MELKNGQHIAWQPLPPEAGTGALLSSQEMLLRSEEFGIREVLFTGTTGSGKTETAVVHPLLSIGLGHGNNLKFLFVKPSHGSMDEIISKTKVLYPMLFGKKAKFYGEKGAKRWVFETGEEIHFKLLDSMETYNTLHHGSQYAKIYFDELSTFDFSLYEIMKTRLRFVPKRHDIPTVLEQMISTTNPWGNSKDQVYNYFIRGEKYSRPKIIKAKIKDRITGKMKEVITKRMAIFGSWRENTGLPDEYIAMMEEWRKTDPMKYKALCQGRWDTSIGGAFERIWEEDKVRIDDFLLPSNGYVFRSMDWGATDPYSISYWYECSGDEIFQIKGKNVEPPVGTLILFSEMYGGTIDQPNIGFDFTAGEVAEMMVEKEKEIIDSMFDDTQGKAKISIGPADTQIWSNVGTTLTIYDEFKAEGIKWKKCKKGAGSRVAGINRFKELLKNTNKRDPKRPWLLVFDSCEHFFNNVPNLQRSERNPDDVKGVDHKMDDIRYAITWKRSKSSFGGIY